MVLDASGNRPRLDEDRYIIYSDSLSALTALKAVYSVNPLVLLVQQYLCEAHVRKKSVLICWVPSHVGVPGNEAADKAAKAACTTSLITNNELPPELQREHLPYRDYFPRLKQHFRRMWQQSWEKEDRKLKEIKPTVESWNSVNCRVRREAVVLARLRIGHTRLTHEHLFTRTNAPVCPRCQETLTVRHIMVECLRLRRLRQRWFPQLENVPADDRMSYILAESRTFNLINIIGYIKGVGIYHKM